MLSASIQRKRSSLDTPSVPRENAMLGFPNLAISAFVRHRDRYLRGLEWRFTRVHAGDTPASTRLIDAKP